MKPMAQALDILQAETKAFMGYLVPTLTILQGKLRARREVVQTCGPLIDALLAGIARRFDATMNSAESIAAAIVHPKFRKDWTDDVLVLDKGKLAMCVCMYIYICVCVFEENRIAVAANYHYKLPTFISLINLR